MSDFITDRDPGDETLPPRHSLNPFTNRCQVCREIADWTGDFFNPCPGHPQQEGNPCP